MQILHLSDTHGGKFWTKQIPSTVDIVVHSGDFLPNPAWDASPRKEEIQFQTAWIRRFGSDIEKWLGDRELLYVPGNHDFIELCDHIKATRISLSPLKRQNQVFVGFPNVNIINRTWNFETEAITLTSLVDKALTEKGTVLVTHTPPAGILAAQYGCTALTQQLMYREHTYKYHLFGHVHMPEYYVVENRNILFSNAAVHSEDKTENWNGNIIITD